MTGWQRVTLRRVCEINPPTPEFVALPPDRDVTFLPLEAVWPDALDTSRRRPKRELESGYTRFREGDVLVPKITPTFEASRSVVARDLLNQIGCGTTELHVLRPREGLDARFLFYVTQSNRFLQEGAGAMQGVAGQKRVPDSVIANYMIDLPPMKGQKRVLDFLDRETARIDTAIAALRRTRQLLEKRLQAERDRTLAPGITELDRHAELPSGWVQTPLMRLTDPLRPIVYGIVQAGPEVPDGVPYIKTGDVADLDPQRLSRTSDSIDATYRRARVRPGDIVIAMRASIGLPVVVPESLPAANLTQGTARVAPASGVNGRWLYQVLRTTYVQTQCHERGVGTTYLTLNIWDLRRLLIPTPPPGHQGSLASEVERLEEQTHTALGLRERQEDLLAERRQALITAAVTGQIDVTAQVAQDLTSPCRNGSGQ
jgi:type I restriction enzyme S subunit